MEVCPICKGGRPEPGWPDDPLLGTTIADRLRIVARLGCGGMGSVYEAERVQLKSRAAVKVMNRFIARQAVAEKRFLREAQIASQLTSPYSVRIHEFGMLDDQRPFIAMEYVEGRELSDILRRDGPMQPQRALAVLSQVAEALEEAHGLGIVHRDLKPANVKLIQRSRGDFVKLLDFGIAWATELGGQEVSRLTHDNTPMGTPSYMSPEVARGLRTVDGRADQYALGVMLYECVTGKPPYKGGTSLDTIVMHLSDPLPAVLDRAPHAPPGLVALIHRSMAKKPESRFPDISAWLDAAQQVSQTLDVGPAAPPPPRPAAVSAPPVDRPPTPSARQPPATPPANRQPTPHYAKTREMSNPPPDAAYTPFLAGASQGAEQPQTAGGTAALILAIGLACLMIAGLGWSLWPTSTPDAEVARADAEPTRAAEDANAQPSAPLVEPESEPEPTPESSPEPPASPEPAPEVPRTAAAAPADAVEHPRVTAPMRRQVLPAEPEPRRPRASPALTTTVVECTSAQMAGVVAGLKSAFGRQFRVRSGQSQARRARLTMTLGAQPTLGVRGLDGRHADALRAAFPGVASPDKAFYCQGEASVRLAIPAEPARAPADPAGPVTAAVATPPAPSGPTTTELYREARNLALSDVSGAVALLRKVVARRPSHARAHKLLGSLFMRQGKRCESVRHYRRYLRFAPGASDAAAVQALIERQGGGCR